MSTILKMFVAELDITMEVTNRRLQLSIDINSERYWDACRLPRKLKKKVRKKAIRTISNATYILEYNKKHFPTITDMLDKHDEHL